MSGRRDQHEEHENSERWLVSYADFITLMFAFFAVLYATSEKDLSKAKEFQESLKKYLVKASPMGGVAPSVNTAEKANSPIESPIPTYNNSKPETVETLDNVEQLVEAQFKGEEKKKFFKDISPDDWGVRLVIPADALFAPGTDKFNPSAMAFVDRLTDIVVKINRKVLIQGHVGEGEAGPYRSTWEFAGARATNFLRYMQKRGGMKSDQFVMTSMGDSKPLYKDPSQKAGNSRLEVVLLNSDMEF